MTDIFERLREYARNCGGPPEDYLTWQAAAEIERLLGICKDKTMLLKDAYTDNERLRAALQRIADDGKNCTDYCRKQSRAALEQKP